MTLHADTFATLDAWRPARHAQESLRQAFLGFVAARPDACQRGCVPGHITASAILLDANESRVLLTLHPRVGAWLQLGGHCEPSDRTLVGAALREAAEESGIDGLTIEPTPIHLDVHPITCSLGVPTRHFDVRFLVRAPLGAQPIRSAESIDLQWWPVDALPPDPTGTTGLPAMLAAAYSVR
jgi:8-oxo-dGTP pyrophosphatase MutT (NUDIX family)